MVDTEKLRALLAAATPGPWECVLSGPAPRIEAVDKRRGMRAAGDPHPVIARMPKDHAPDSANGDIIAAAVNALPELLDEVERLRARKAELCPCVRRYETPGCDECGGVGAVMVEGLK